MSNQAPTIPPLPNWEVIDQEVMSNFDHEINIEIAEYLKRDDVIAYYSAWGFSGLVWFDKKDQVYKCRVSRYHNPVAGYSGTLQQIMEAASGDYGSD